jgi:hypothetical protein
MGRLMANEYERVQRAVLLRSYPKILWSCETISVAKDYNL